MAEQLPSRRRSFVLVGASCAVELAVAPVVAALYESAFASGTTGEGTAVTASYVALLAGSTLGLALVAAAAYCAVLDLRPSAATAFVALACAPLALAGTAALYGTLACLALV